MSDEVDIFALGSMAVYTYRSVDGGENRKQVKKTRKAFFKSSLLPSKERRLTTAFNKIWETYQKYMSCFRPVRSKVLLKILEKNSDMAVAALKSVSRWGLERQMKEYREHSLGILKEVTAWGLPEISSEGRERLSSIWDAWGALVDPDGFLYVTNVTKNEEEILSFLTRKAVRKGQILTTLTFAPYERVWVGPGNDIAERMVIRACGLEG
ncbi:hypothetical protein BC829DRAFT_415909 [Chytridium lagenaria]|nr:hypothetical protein BC829DRAFT_415909 [Chytridium lagenaria]